MAAAAGVPLPAVAISAISPGSVLVSAAVLFGLGDPATAALAETFTNIYLAGEETAATASMFTVVQR